MNKNRRQVTLKEWTLTFMIGSDLVPIRVDDFVDAVEETVDAETVDDDTDTNN